MKKQKGITLIALIITIIVMLILVGVTVAAALNGGLFTKAKGAGSKTQKEADRELLQAELVAAYDERTGSIDITKLRNNLGSDWRIDGEVEPYTVTSPNGNMYKVWANGKIEDIEEESQPQQPTDQKYFTYTFDEDNKTATITGVAEEYQEKWMYGDYSMVTSIKDGESYIKDVILPSTVTNNGETYTVTKIGNEAFGNYYGEWADENDSAIQNGFTSFVIPNTVTEIGDSAFAYCRKVTNITIGNNVTRIEGEAFRGCSSLTNITIPDSVTSIGYCAFGQCSSLTNITIPDSVTSIGVCAFRGCSSLTNITIPDSVTSIGESAFSYCNSLTNITIPNSVTSIEAYAFSECSSLTNIIIPDSVTSIGAGAFINCSSDLQINCIASSKPSGWDNNWNKKNWDNEFYTPIWGYTGE